MPPKHTMMGPANVPESHNGDDTAASVETTAAAETTGSPTEKASSLDGQGEEAGEPASGGKKPLSFYLALACLMIMVLLCSMDSTIMAVSIPVSYPDKTSAVASVMAVS